MGAHGDEARLSGVPATPEAVRLGGGSAVRDALLARIEDPVAVGVAKATCAVALSSHGTAGGTVPVACLHDTPIVTTTASMAVTRG